MTPTQHTLNHFRKNNYLAAVVEHWNSHAAIRQDLFGFVDVVAVGQAGETIFVQATTWDNISTRVRKILDDSELRRRAFRLCLQNSVCVVGWKQSAGKGSRWVGKWRYLVPEDFSEELPEWNPTTTLSET